jgi:hypothetical protein
MARMVLDREHEAADGLLQPPFSVDIDPWARVKSVRKIGSF